MTVLFVRFTPLDYDHDPQALAVLQGFSQELIALIGHYDGFLNRIDMGDKGSKLIILFGAPIAHEDDAERAMRFALDIHMLGQAHGLKLAIGMSSGFVYCGHVGSAQRQEYTVMGDSVNLAARLMQHASDDEVLVAETVWAATQQIFDWERLAPLRVKGKREPVVIYRTSRLADSSPAQARAQQAPMACIGRSAEQRRLGRLLTLALHKRGRVLLLTGEAGMGKSRLLDVLAAQARVQQASIYRGQCQAYGASYQGWGSIWRTLLGIDEHQPALEQYTQLEDTLAAINRRLVLRTPLLAGPLGMALPDNDFTHTLEPQLRAELTHSLLLECLRGLAHKPMLLLIDNAQWLDSLGLALFELLAAAIDELPVLLVLAARPAPAIQRLLSGQQRHVHALHIDELLPDDAAAFAQAYWSQQQAEMAYSPALAQQILERAQGNPLYIEELISYSRNHPGEAGAVLPESLHQLLISRIDQLDTAHQSTLKAASVLGSSFHMRWLSEGYTQLGGRMQVAQHLEHLQELNFTACDDSAPELEYRFCHILLQETAYESIAFATRAALHEQMGSYLELHRAREDALLDSIAYHYGRSERQDKQRVYFRRAGDLARSAYANSRALDYYQRLLPLVSEAEQAVILQAMSEIWRLTGEWQAAEAAARQALAQAEDTSLIGAEAACTLGAILARTQSYSAALPWFQQAHAALVNTAGAALCRTLEQLSFAYFQLGDLNTALSYAEQQFALAEQIGDQIGRCDAAAQIGYIALQRGKNDEALSIQQQVYVQAAALGYRRRVVLAASDIAEIHWTRGAIEQALEWLLKSLDEANSIGYRWVMGMMIGNAGLIYARHGDDSQALACFQRSLALALELSNRPGITQALGWLASLFETQGSAQALPVCQRAIALARELELVYELSEQLELRARLLLQRQDYAAALRDCDEALELAQRTEAHEVVQAATQLRLRLRVLSGDMTKAVACSTIAALLNENPDNDQRVALLITQWQIDNRQEASKNEALQLLGERYHAEGNASDRRLYAELSGELLDRPAPLAALPQELLGAAIELSSLLQRAGVGSLSFEV